MAKLKYTADNTVYDLATMEEFGFLLRQNSTQYSVGDTVFCSTLPSGLLLECITAGTTASSTPNFSSATVDGTATDGTVTWLFQKFSNSDEGNGSGIEIGDVSSFTAVGKHGRVLLTWNDPSDVVVDGVTLARWKGTTIIRKAGSAPSSKTDGTLVVDSLTYNAYASSPLTDTGLTDGVVYYYRAFPHTTGGTYTVGSSVSCTPGKESLSVPVLASAMTYTGLYQNASFTGYDSAKMSISDDVGGTDVGSYTAVFSLIGDDYKWSDDSVESKNVVWNIGKATGSVSLSKNNVSLDTSTLSDTITVTRSGDGTISAVSSDTSIATVSVSGTTVTVTAVATGSATVTISVAEGTSYLAPSDVVVSVEVELFPATLNDASWSLISQEAAAGTASNHWDVGDCKEITLNGSMGTRLSMSNLKLCVYILDFNHTEGSKGNLNGNHIVFGGFKTALTSGTDVALCDWNNTNSYGGYHGDGTVGNTDVVFSMNHHNSNYQNYGGWKGCDLRYDILGATSTQPSTYKSKSSGW